ncbi:hypothetical protein ACI7RC_01080 [Brevibacillus sp. B_LB10_24]|uniref:hypothetical protein n=1 Tax=Brevibacillus sp. B_LB10_24 TaxID=3380645 RepID=UPI0038BD59B9
MTGGGGPVRDGTDEGGWQELLRECVLFGLVFKAAVIDLDAMQTAPLKLSYREIVEELSRWAERRHYRMKRQLRQIGCILLTSRKQGSCYCVQVRLRGYLREVVYSIELLQAECRERVGLWLKEHGRNDT